MHPEAHDYVADCVGGLGLRGDVLDFGGRNINGGVRHLIASSRWVAVDIVWGDGVDIVADASTVDVGQLFDVVLSLEVFEHTDVAAGIVANAHRHLKPGGYFVATMAGMARAPHGAGGGPVGDEFYRNVDRELLTGWLIDAGFTKWVVDELGEDIRCWARK